MSSILTNNGAMVALQTLQSINKNLGMTQSEISTGKSVATAKDNSAVWAISKVMESDVAGFKSISDSLSLGESTVATGRATAEGITDILREIKDKVTGAQGENVDRAKLQQDIKSLTGQIESMVGAAQFNGQNLIDGSAKTSVKVLSSLDRASDGSVKASNIGVTSANLSTKAGTTGVTGFTPVTSGALATGANLTVTGALFADAANATTGTKAIAKEDIAAGATPAALVAGDTITRKVGDVEASYRIQVGDNIAAVNKGMANALKASGVAVTYDEGAGTITYNGPATTSESNASRGRGDMFGLSTIDVTTDKGASKALAELEGMIQKSINVGASLGSSEKRISIQNDFVSKLTDSLKSGIGSLVDANMEEASARLQALQVQQQLATQSLSIANQAPQSILSLFR